MLRTTVSWHSFLRNGILPKSGRRHTCCPILTRTPMQTLRIIYTVRLIVSDVFLQRITALLIVFNIRYPFCRSKFKTSLYLSANILNEFLINIIQIQVITLFLLAFARFRFCIRYYNKIK